MPVGRSDAHVPSGSGAGPAAVPSRPVRRPLSWLPVWVGAVSPTAAGAECQVRLWSPAGGSRGRPGPCGLKVSCSCCQTRELRGCVGGCRREPRELPSLGAGPRGRGVGLLRGAHSEPLPGACAQLCPRPSGRRRCWKCLDLPRFGVWVLPSPHFLHPLLRRHRWGTGGGLSCTKPLGESRSCGHCRRPGPRSR